MSGKATSEAVVHEPVKVLVLGCSYAGLSAATNLADLFATGTSTFGHTSDPNANSIPVEITMVDERDGFFHLIGTPLVFADKEYAAKAWKRFDELSVLQSDSVHFIHGSVSKIDCEQRHASIIAHGTSTQVERKYDYLVAATGLRRAFPTVPYSLTKQEYLTEAHEQIDRVRSAQHGVVIFGGGAVGVEMAAELKHVDPSASVTLIHSREKLMSSEPLPDEFKDKTLQILGEMGVRVVVGKRVKDVVDKTDRKVVKLSDGSELEASEVLNAISKPSPTTSYLPSKTLSSDGLIKVAPTLHFDSIDPNSGRHFASGDIVETPGIKRAGGALHMSHYIATNIHQQVLYDRGLISTPEFMKLPDHPPSMGVALGGTAIGYSAATGVKCGKEVMDMLFNDDLGFDKCWSHLNLGGKPKQASVG